MLRNLIDPVAIEMLINIKHAALGCVELDKVNAIIVETFTVAYFVAVMYNYFKIYIHSRSSSQSD